MKRMTSLLAVSWLVTVVAAEAPANDRMAASQTLVALEFVDANGGGFEIYTTATESPDVYRAYLEAEPEARYSIRARNLSSRRVGIVIAVDGRNIISGERSELASSESMYVLEPHQTATYSGWRTSESEVRRFYFTRAGNSYASRIGDESAIGVVAAAVFEAMPDSTYRPRSSQSRPGAPAAAEESSDASASESRASAGAGTGFGEHEHSRVVRVSFSPARRPSQRAFFKYEWREQLCARGIKSCAPENRFWPEHRQGFVPLPPGEPG